MPYPKNLLNDHETVALDLHPHWWFYTKALLGVAGAVILAILVLIFIDEGTLRTVLMWASFALIVVSLIWLIQRYAIWSTTNFVVTSDRVIYRSGVVRKTGIEIPLERVNNVSATQGMFERFLGAGDLLIESGGESGQQRFTDIKNPNRAQNLIHAQREANNTRMYGGRGGGTDVATQLEKLEGMLERGTLTQAEFDVQKQRLLEG